jgi:DNA-binding transcriptional ArsR family regulator
MFLGQIAMNVDKRLERLAELGSCSCVSVSKFATELSELADKVMPNDAAQGKAKGFKALADSTRLRILGLLSVREMCVCEVMVALDLTQSTASHHLGILENAGFVRGRKIGKWVFYSLVESKVVKELF